MKPMVKKIAMRLYRLQPKKRPPTACDGPRPIITKRWISWRINGQIKKGKLADFVIENVDLTQSEQRVVELQNYLLNSNKIFDPSPRL